jgi:hypothetical protein
MPTFDAHARVHSLAQTPGTSRLLNVYVADDRNVKGVPAHGEDHRQTLSRRNGSGNVEISKISC